MKKLLSIVLVLALSVNFVLYSSQSYAPPKADSISYSIVNCPSHEGGNHTNVIKVIFGSDSENGAEKDCFCYSCCTQRISPYITIHTANLTLTRNTYHTFLISESSHTEDSYKNLPIRSPPAVSS